MITCLQCGLMMLMMTFDTNLGIYVCLMFDVDVDVDVVGEVDVIM